MAFFHSLMTECTGGAAVPHWRAGCPVLAVLMAVTVCTLLC